MADIIDKSDSDKDTDTESLPEIIHAKFTGVNKSKEKNVWTLHQSKPDEEPTDESDVEGVEDEDQSSKMKKKLSRKQFEMGFSSSTIKIRSNDKDDSNSHNVEEELFSVAFNKNNPETCVFDMGNKTVTEKEKEKTAAVEDMSEESEGEDADPHTDNDLVQVSFDDYKEIMDNEAAKNDLIQELKSYETCITQKVEKEDHNDQDNNETSEDDESSESDEEKVPKVKVPKVKVPKVKVPENEESDGEDPLTENSDLEVPMMEYYKIRHQTEPGNSPKADGNLNQDSSSKFDTQLLFQSIAKPSTSITFTGKDDDPVTDEECSTSSNENEEGKEKEVLEGESESEEEVTHNSEVQVSMKDYYHIRKQTTPSEAADEYVLMLNQVQSLIRMRSVDNNDPDTKAQRDWPEDQEEFVTSLNKVKESDDDNECTDDEQMSEEINDRASKPEDPVDEDVDQLNKDDETSNVQMKDNFGKQVKIKISEFKDEECKPETRPGNIPIIRLVEMDGFQAAIGVACFDPQSPTTDSVHGIKFIEADDVTEEISTISDMEDQLSMAEGGHQSPATEDEAVSEFEADSVPSKQEYSLPQTRCKIFYTKVTNEGKCSTIEENLLPEENLSLGQFIRETENVSECDVLQVTDDDLEDLPSDNAQTKKKVKVKIPSHLNVEGKKVGAKQSSPKKTASQQEKSIKKKRPNHHRGPKKPKNEAEN